MKEPKRYSCGNGEGMFEDDKNGHWIEYSEHKAIVETLTEQLRQSHISGSFLAEIRQAFADYYISEGCSCCRDESKHNEAEKRLAELLKPDMYEDGSGFNWYLYASTDH